MPKLPDQRGFYDDIRGFQRKDIKVRTEAFAPSPDEQKRVQWLVGILVFVFLLGTLAIRLYEAREDRKPQHAPAFNQGVWKGVAGSPSNVEAPPEK